MNTIQVNPGQKPSSLLPLSKSHMNRLLILASLSKTSTTLIRPHEEKNPDDVDYLIRSLKSVGVLIEEDGTKIVVQGNFPACEPPGETLELNVGEGGTTLRFLLCLLAQGRRRYKITGRGRLGQRPLTPLLTVLSEMGVDIRVSAETFPIEIQGPIRVLPKQISLSSVETSQFSSALALSLLQYPEIKLDVGLIPSRPYFELSLDLIQRMRQGQNIFIIPQDMSSAVFPAALATLQGEKILMNLHSLDHLQSDSVFFHYLERMGGKAVSVSQGLKIQRVSDLRAGIFQCQDCPDLVPGLSFLCAYAQGVSELSGLAGLRHKESDRIEEILKVLKAFSVRAEYDQQQERLIIYGPAARTRSPVSIVASDHRIVMMAFLFLSYNQGGLLGDTDSVSKSFPNFFNA